jgi:ribosomal protein L11 methyltransferase
VSRTSSPDRRPAAAAGRYYALRLVVPPEREEAAVAACWEAGCLGVEVVSAARIPRRPRLALRAYFPALSPRRRLSGALMRSLAAAGVAPRRPLRLARVRERAWAAIWQRSLRPMRIGRTILVVPEGCAVPPAGGRHVVRVRFGQAFGTGEHASTRLSLRLLESSLRPGDRVIDLGTGTAILAMAACRLGAGAVTGVDNDPIALRVARRNLGDNRLRRRVALRLGDAALLLHGARCDVALVNIGAASIARLLPGLRAALRPGGRAILAGILVEDEAALLKEAARLGLRLRSRLRSRPWSALLLIRPL